MSQAAARTESLATSPPPPVIDNSSFPLLRIPIYIGTCRVDALFDTDSTVSLLSLHTFKQLKPSSIKLIKNANEITNTFRSVSGNAMLPLGLYEIRLVFQNRHTISHFFYFIAQVDESCILGLDFITTNEIIVNAKSRVLRYLHSGQPQFMQILHHKIFSITV
jgi:hypothetical protein